MVPSGVQALSSQCAGSSPGTSFLRASLAEGQQQEVLTGNLGQRYREGTVKVERAEPGDGGLTNVTHQRVPIRS